MKLLEHERSTKPQTMLLGTDPLVVWLNPHVELHIEWGDQLGEIAVIVKKYWCLRAGDCYRLVGYWFAVGERVSGKRAMGPWLPRKELNADPNRIYTPAQVSRRQPGQERAATTQA